MAQIGDTVRVGKSVLGQYYYAEGKITAVRSNCQLIQVQGDWWLATNDLENSYEVVEQRDEQLRCHYCGMPASSFGFFDEPICRECGG